MLQPLNNNVIVKAPPKETQTKGGVYVPETTDADKPETGEVVSVGENVKSIVAGDKIVFKKFAPDEFKDGDADYLILNADDILAKIV